MFKTKVFLYKTLSEGRLYEAEYFYTISQSAKFTIIFVKLTEKEQANEDQAASVREAVEKITNLGPNVILLYTSKEKMDRLLNQQVILIVFPMSSSPSSFSNSSSSSLSLSSSSSSSDLLFISSFSFHMVGH